MREVDDRDQRIDLERAMARLTAKQRLALRLWCQGYTQAEIARACGVSAWGVRRMVHHGLWVVYCCLT